MDTIKNIGTINLHRNNDTDTLHIVNQIEYNRLFKAIKEYPVNDLSIYNTIPEKIFYSNIHSTITIGCLKNLKYKGNMTAYNLLYGNIKGISKPVDIEDIQNSLYVFILDSYNNNNSVLDIQDNEIVLTGDFILQCYKHIYSIMNSIKRNDKYTRSLYLEIDNQIVLSSDIAGLNALCDFSKAEFTTNLRFIYDMIDKIGGKNADDMHTLFEYRLQGYKFNEIAEKTGLSKDRLKYCNRLLHKVGIELGYNCNTYTYTNTQKVARYRAKKRVTYSDSGCTILD